MVKNNVIVGLADRQIKYLGKTHEGRKHDKRIADEEKMTCPEGSSVYRDTGFQGHVMEGVAIHQPKKKPRGGQLSSEDKEHNRLISSVRVVVEHVIAGIKRCRIVKEVFRNTMLGYEEVVMNLACGLHNFRSDCRMSSY
jgi:DDE superfamily endonuclease